jgi:hypothetical protein
MSPVKKIGEKKFVYNDNHKLILKSIQENKELVKSTLKEIVYYLTGIEGIAPSARAILVKIFKKYSIDQDLITNILFIERRYSEAYFSSKLEVQRRKRVESGSGKSSRIISCLKLAIPFLDSNPEILNLLLLNKSVKEQLRETCLHDILSRAETSLSTRKKLYQRLIPQRYKVCRA